VVEFALSWRSQHFQNVARRSLAAILYIISFSL
jgi:hypothetical protein